MHVVWRDNRNGGADLYVRTSRNSGSTFGTEIRVDTGDVAGRNASVDPDVAADGDNAYVVWVDNRDAGSLDIWMNRSIDAGVSWAAAPTKLDQDAFAHDSIQPRIVALSGVVVNDSLVLIDAANGYRREGKPLFGAIHAAGVRRFRPILLTSLTTFLGLIPMITETSAQAQFLIPMAVSLGFGVLFATLIILLLVPSYYLVLHDVLALLGRDEPVVSPPRPGDAGPRKGATVPAPAE